MKLVYFKARIRYEASYLVSMRIHAVSNLLTKLTSEATQ